MVWVKLEAEMPESAKYAFVGPLGLALQVAGLCYCNRQLTDGFIPEATARKLIDIPPREFARVLPLMLAVAPGEKSPVWYQVEGGYLIHDFEDYQPSRDKVLADQAKKNQDKVKAGKAGAAKRWQNGSRPHGSEIAEPIAEPIAERWQNDASGTVTDPDPQGDEVSNFGKTEVDRYYARSGRIREPLRGRFGVPGAAPTLVESRRVRTQIREEAERELDARRERGEPVAEYSGPRLLKPTGETR